MKICLLQYFEILYYDLLTYLRTVLTRVMLVMSVIKQHNVLIALITQNQPIITFVGVLLKREK